MQYVHTNRLGGGDWALSNLLEQLPDRCRKFCPRMRTARVPAFNFFMSAHSAIKAMAIHETFTEQLATMLGG